MLTQPTHPVPNRRRGFTLIEVTVTVSIVTVLAGMLLPVFARAREKAQCDSAKTSLKEMMIGIAVASSDYDDRLPLSLKLVLEVYQVDVSLEDLGGERYRDQVGFIWEYFPLPQDPDDPYFDPRIGGRISTIKKPEETVLIRIEGNGLCGFIEGYADIHVEIVDNPTGFDEVGAQIDEVQRMGLEAAIDILALAGEEAPAPEDLKQAVADPDIVEDVALSLDRDLDGYVTATDLLLAAYPPPAPGEEFPLPGDETPFTILQDFVTEAVELLELDPQEEGFDEFLKISVEDLQVLATMEAGELFSYENLADLTINYLANPGPAMGLVAKLFAAEAADQRGDLEDRDDILQAYRNQLDAQSGKSILPEDAEDLEMLSRTLQPNP